MSGAGENSLVLHARFTYMMCGSRAQVIKSCTLYFLTKFAHMNVGFLVLQALIAHKICGDMRGVYRRLRVETEM
jgi:hypothetical protein